MIKSSVARRNARKCCSELEGGSRDREKVCFVGDKLCRLVFDRESMRFALLTIDEVSSNLQGSEALTRNPSGLALRSTDRASSAAYHYGLASSYEGNHTTSEVLLIGVDNVCTLYT